MGGDRIGSVERLRFLSAVSLSQRFIPKAEVESCVVDDTLGNTDHVRCRRHRVDKISSRDPVDRG